MIKNPIQKVTNKLQYRAIGIVYGIYSPLKPDQLNRGSLKDKEGNVIETVLLGKALSLIKKHIDLNSNYFWIVYPRNKNVNNLHLQVTGIWDPYKLNDFDDDPSKKDPNLLLEDLNLNDNYFSIRGELVYVNSPKKEFVVKVCSKNTSKKLKKNNFKITVAGDISLEFLHSFVSLDLMREGNTLQMLKYEVIEKIFSKKE